LTTLESRVQEWVCLLLVSSNINSLTQAGTVKIFESRAQQKADRPSRQPADRPSRQH